MDVSNQLDAIQIYLGESEVKEYLTELEEDYETGVERDNLIVIGERDKLDKLQEKANEE